VRDAPQRLACPHQITRLRARTNTRVNVSTRTRTSTSAKADASTNARAYAGGRVTADVDACIRATAIAATTVAAVSITSKLREGEGCWQHLQGLKQPRVARTACFHAFRGVCR
jgi:hypothetical protein